MSGQINTSALSDAHWLIHLLYGLRHAHTLSSKRDTAQTCGELHNFTLAPTNARHQESRGNHPSDRSSSRTVRSTHFQTTTLRPSRSDLPFLLVDQTWNLDEISQIRA